MTPEYTGPPIGDPPGHVHEDTPAVDAVLEAAEETDELIEQVQELEKISGQRHTELLIRIESCQTKLEALSTATAAENPLLTQILSSLAEMRAEILTLKSLPDTNPPEPNVLVVTETPPAPDLQNQESPIDEQPAGNVENPPEPERRKNRFI